MSGVLLGVYLMGAALAVAIPEFLHEADDEIRIRGHRISLYDLLWEYNQGYSAEEIALRFPTLKLATVHKVVAFYLDNQAEVDTYLGAYSAALQGRREGAPPPASVAELQGRLEQIRRKAHNAAQVSH